MASAADLHESAILRYSRGAIWFHWVIAALIIGNLILGLFHEDFGKAATPWIMFFHKSTGLAILALSVGRLFWRVRNRPPVFDDALRPWEKTLAHITHWLFYALMIGIPLSGWVLVSTNDRSTSFFGLFDIAPLPFPRGREFHELWEEVHEIVGKVMIGLILLHVAGAAKHHLQGHRHLIGRMTPWGNRNG